MSKFIMVMCKTADNVGGSYTPHRFWPNGSKRTLEVVPDQVVIDWLNKNRPERRGAEDPAARALLVQGGPYLPDGQPDWDRIADSGVKAIELCPHLSFMGENDEAGGMAGKALEAARQVAQRQSEKLGDAEVEIERLAGENARLQSDLDKAAAERQTVGKELADLMQENDRLRQAVAAAAAAPAAPAGGGEPAEEGGGAEEGEEETTADSGGTAAAASGRQRRGNAQRGGGGR